MRTFTWLWRAAVFFVLFAFALNNQNEATVRWFFGAQWRAPMVFIVLAAFALGCSVGVLAMVPSWWRHRRSAMRQALAPGSANAAPDTMAVDAAPAPATEPAPLHPPRDGL